MGRLLLLFRGIYMVKTKSNAVIPSKHILSQTFRDIKEKNGKKKIGNNASFNKSNNYYSFNLIWN